MRVRAKNQGISVHAISGPYVVLLGFDVTAARRKGLLGFALHRRDHGKGGRSGWLQGFRTFAETDPDPPPGHLVSTEQHPVQAFNWGDYTAKPNHRYTYTVQPLYGRPAALRKGPAVEVTIETANEDKGRYSVHFNRGVAGSQAYARKFGNVAPDKIADPKKRKEAYTWLSRGLEEAILGFIGKAKSGRFGLRASVYEFSYAPVLEAFGAAKARGADVKIVYDRRARGPFEATEKAAKAAGIRKLMIPRKTNSAISHNKFIVLLRDGEPVEVWTGSTNFTEGGIFGQSNVGFVIRDRDVARQYLDYWNRLSRDPEFKEIRPANVEATPDPEGLPAPGITPLFSPRSSLGALEWYGERMGAAESFVGFTAAFGISGTLAPALLEDRPYLRFIMVESEGNKKVPKATPGGPPPKSQFQTFLEIQKVASNRIAQGAILARGGRSSADEAIGGALHRWLTEKLTDLNFHVKYLHTKYMLLDVLSDDPIVISGSANFSAASTQNNDENMVIVRGDTELADMYLGEFMRLFAHFYFRDIATRHAAKRAGKRPEWDPHLAPDDSWTDPWFAAGSARTLERRLLR
jgi:phosphatidylserine/phosphatidylglycerophosphate/cardiolipin synthase-like enzyme